MNITKFNTETPTMTLKEITDLLDVRHNNAMKIVERMAEDREFGELQKISSSYKNNIGAILPLETYSLDKRQSIAVSAMLNTALLMRVIDRWQELEQQNNWLMPSSVTKAIEHKKSLLGEIEKCDMVIKSHIDDLQSLLDVGKGAKNLSPLPFDNTTNEQKESILRIVQSRQSRDGQPVLLGLITNLASRRKIFGGHDYKEQVVCAVNKLVIEGELKLFEKQNHTNGTITKSYQLIK